MGYIKISRKIMDNPVWMDKPFSEGQAWVDLILLADYETKRKMWRGHEITFKRGDVNVSLNYLATKWGWSREKVRRYIKRLESENMVIKKTYDRDRTVITILNYDTYQDALKNKVQNKDNINWENID